jgi:hypothetical protein
MAQNTLLTGLRNQYLTSLFGRRLALDPKDYLVGPRDLRVQIEGMSSAGSTVLSTAAAASGEGLGSTALSPYGVSLVGGTGASGTSHWLQDPIPGVRKVLYNPTTGSAVVYASTASYYCTTGSPTSTYQIATMTMKGSCIEMMGLTTALWGILNWTSSNLSTAANISWA